MRTIKKNFNASKNHYVSYKKEEIYLYIYSDGESEIENVGMRNQW